MLKKAEHKITTVKHLDSVGIFANKVLGFGTPGNVSITVALTYGSKVLYKSPSPSTGFL